MTVEKMDPRVKELWVTALESGEYSQTSGQLRDGRGYCCLGVLCDLHSKETGTPWSQEFENGSWMYSGRDGFLPTPVAEWAGLSSLDPTLYTEGFQDISASMVNDTMGGTFTDIAALVRENL